MYRLYDDALTAAMAPHSVLADIGAPFEFVERARSHSAGIRAMLAHHLGD